MLAASDDESPDDKFFRYQQHQQEKELITSMKRGDTLYEQASS